MDDKYRINLDGSWTLVDLYQFPRAYSQVYAFYYVFSDSQQVDQDRREITFRAFPWKGGYSAVSFYQQLDVLTPPKHRPTILSLHYASPGWLDLGLFCASAFTVQQVVSRVCKTVRECHTTYNEIYRGLQERKLLKLSVTEKELKLLDTELEYVLNVTDKMAKLLGLDDLTRLNELTGHPLATLKILMSLFRRVRKIAEYQTAGKISLGDQERDVEEH